MATFDVIRENRRKSSGRARWMRAFHLLGSVPLVSGGGLSQQAGNDSENENVGEVASADTLYTGTCPSGSVFEPTADGRPGCRHNFDVCQDVFVDANASQSRPTAAAHYGGVS